MPLQGGMDNIEIDFPGPLPPSTPPGWPTSPQSTGPELSDEGVSLRNPRRVRLMKKWELWNQYKDLGTSAIDELVNEGIPYETGVRLVQLAKHGRVPNWLMPVNAQGDNRLWYALSYLNNQFSKLREARQEKQGARQQYRATRSDADLEIFHNALEAFRNIKRPLLRAERRGEVIDLP